MTTALTRLPRATLDKHLAFLATSDAGKTYGAKGEVEHLLDAGKRVCVIDPTGVWWGLRLKPNGKTPSPYQLPIFGGVGPRGMQPVHTDVSVTDSQGARVAELIAGGDFSAIVDVSTMSSGGRTRFLADFAEGVSQASRRPLHLVIDEAHIMMPQAIMGGDFDAARMVGAANHLVSGGRAQGLRIMLLSQRPAKLHNDALTQVQTLVTMFTMAPADIAPAKKWVTANADPAAAKELLASLPTLPVGHGWVYAPRLGVLERIAFGPISTFDSSAAPTDADLERPPVKLGALDLETIRAELSAGTTTPPPGPVSVIDEAKLKTARDGGYTDGVAEGRRLEREALTASIATHPEVQRLLRLADRNARRAAAQELLGAVRKVGEAMIAANPAELVDPQKPRAPAALNAPSREPLQIPAPIPFRAPATSPPPALASTPVEGASSEAELPEAAHVLVHAARCAHRPVSWADAAVLAGRIPQGGSFEGARRALKDAGWQEPIPNDLDRAEGLSPAAVINELEPKVAAGKKASAHAPRGFRVLAESGPRTREQLAEVLGIRPRGGHFEHLWRTLRRSPLTEELEDGFIDVAPVLRELRSIAQEEG